MSIKITGALRDHMLVDGSLYAAVTGMVIRIYSGSVPTNPEDDTSGNTLLVTISTNGAGTGLAFEAAAANGMLTKAAAAVWSGTCAATGTATFYRLMAIADAGGSSSTAHRVQGTVGVAGADLNVTNDYFSVSEVKRIDYYVIGMLTS